MVNRPQSTVHGSFNRTASIILSLKVDAANQLISIGLLTKRGCPKWKQPLFYLYFPGESISSLN